MIKKSFGLFLTALIVFVILASRNSRPVISQTPTLREKISDSSIAESVVETANFLNSTYQENFRPPGLKVTVALAKNLTREKNILELNTIGQIPVDPRNQKTKVPGIWAAGDCTDGLYHQNNIASGDAVKALEDIYMEMHTK